MHLLVIVQNNGSSISKCKTKNVVGRWEEILNEELSDFYSCKMLPGRSQWPCGLGRRSAAVHLLRLWVRIPLGAWVFVCCECCVLSGRGLWDELITRPEESYRLWCVVVCDLETSRLRRPWPALGRSAKRRRRRRKYIYMCVCVCVCLFLSLSLCACVWE